MLPEDINNLLNLTSKLPNSMESFMEQLKVFGDLLYAILTASCPLFLELNTITRSLMEYKPAARALIKRQQRAAIARIITLQTKHLFRGESNQLAGFMLMKNNIRARNPLLYNAEVPLDLYRYDSSTAAGGKGKFDREEKPVEDSCGNKKANPKVEIHYLLRKHFFLSFFFFFWSGLQGPKAYSLWGGVFPSPSIG